MKERNKSAIMKKRENKDQRENDMEKIVWASRKKTTTNKVNIFSKGGKKNQMVPDFLTITPSNTTMEQHFQKNSQCEPKIL